MDWYEDCKEHIDLLCLKCKKRLYSESISTWSSLLYCDNKKCSRYGLYTRAYIRKYIGKHYPELRKFIKTLKVKKSIGE